MDTPTKRAVHIEEDVHEVPTRDLDRLDIANATTATRNLAIAPEAVTSKTDGAIAVEVDAQDLLTSITRGNQQQEADRRLPTRIGPLDLHHQTNLPTQTQTTLCPPFWDPHHPPRFALVAVAPHHRIVQQWTSASTTHHITRAPTSPSPTPATKEGKTMTGRIPSKPCATVPRGEKKARSDCETLDSRSRMRRSGKVVVEIRMNGISSGEGKERAGSGMLARLLARGERSESRLLGQKGCDFELAGIVVPWRIALAGRWNLGIGL